jgi:hypothetical protein
VQLLVWSRISFVGRYLGKETMMEVDGCFSHVEQLDRQRRL